jgi:RNA polymerase subunit RPABC4/transcription elongation factor Spt4
VTSVVTPNCAAMLTTLLTCGECGREDFDHGRGWRGYLVDLDDDGADEVVFFCPRCAAREFGDCDLAE